MSPKSLPNPAEALILPDGPVGEDDAEMLGGLIHRPHHTENDDNDDDKEGPLPWWKTPSSLWLMAILPFSTIAASATMAPKIEIYTLLACSVHKPDIFERALSTLALHVPVASPLHLLDTISSPTISLHQNSTLGLTSHNECASDPVVQAAVAKLSAVIALCIGILACLTTGWWGSFSDRYGRTRVMGISIIGLLLTELNLIFVARFIHRIPGGYWLLVVGPLIEGCLGGMTTAIAAFHAYLADTSTESNRSHIFSLSLGLIFTGMALGPSLGGLLIRFTGSTLSVFWVAAGLHAFYAFLVCVVIPESVGVRDMQEARVRWASAGVGGSKRVEGGRKGKWAAWAARVFAFLSPLAVFWPPKNNGKPGRRRDWGLFLIAAGYGFTITIMGSYTYKFQYAAAAFGWTAETIGYWLSLVGAARAVFLTAVLPLIIKIFKPKPLPLPVPEAVPSLSAPSESSSSSSTPSSSHTAVETSPLLEPPSSAQTLAPQPAATPSQSQSQQSQYFDLQLARASLFIDLLAYAGMALAPTPAAFTLASMAGAMGTGFSPAVQSVALGMYLKREVTTVGAESDGSRKRKGGTSVGETGKLFGALSVVQALCSQIMGPALYGLVYMKTVASYPRTIFFMSLVSVGTSFALLAFVRIGGRGEKGSVGVGVEGDEEEGLVGRAVEVEREERGALRRREGNLVDVGVGESGE